MTRGEIKIASLSIIAILLFAAWVRIEKTPETTIEDQYKLYRACLQNQDCIKTMDTEDWLEYYRLKWELEDD